MLAGAGGIAKSRMANVANGSRQTTNGYGKTVASKIGSQARKSPAAPLAIDMLLQ
jgi:hypothetical protein